MKDQDHIAGRLKTLSREMKSYVEKRAELLYLNISDHLARMLAQSVHKFIGILLILAGVLFLMAALALYLGELLNSQALGYLIVSIPILVIGLLFTALRPRNMTRNMQQKMARELLKAFPEQKSDGEEPDSVQTIHPNRAEAPSGDGSTRSTKTKTRS